MLAEPERPPLTAKKNGKGGKMEDGRNGGYSRVLMPIEQSSIRTFIDVKSYLTARDLECRMEHVIENFRHKGLAQLFKDDDRRKLPADQIDKIGRILARLNEAMTIQDMGLPGYRLHPLKGELASFWSVSVSGNWRIIFRFENGSAYDVDLVDYH